MGSSRRSNDIQTSKCVYCHGDYSTMGVNGDGERQRNEHGQRT